VAKFGSFLLWMMIIIYPHLLDKIGGGGVGKKKKKKPPFCNIFFTRYINFLDQFIEFFNLKIFTQNLITPTP
jgi:hypothetical protein